MEASISSMEVPFPASSALPESWFSTKGSACPIAVLPHCPDSLNPGINFTSNQPIITEGVVATK
jgi:hypothetical protein